MSRTFRISLDETALQCFHERLIQWIEAEAPLHVHLLLSGKDHQLSPGPHRYKLLCGLNWKEEGCTTLDGIDSYSKDSFCFGVLPYELKNNLEDLQSTNRAYYADTGYLLMKPEVLLRITHTGLCTVESTSYSRSEEVFKSISKFNLAETAPNNPQPTVFESDISDQQYLQNVERIRSEIADGNVYELSYCRNYHTRQKTNVFALFQSFVKQNATPYSAFIKNGKQYIVSGSMERFLCKEGSTVTSQPIKGTAYNSGFAHDMEREALLASEKERAENLMIVDLVRNDLSKSAIVGSVTVPELFGIYSYPNVHQMISTVQAKAPAGISLGQFVKDAFPMGSMTGAPKLKAMQLIEELEQFQRGIYSGAIGYIDAEGDFDWNVVIRTVIYDATSDALSIPVGSAITYDSVPEDELNECRVKVERIMNLVRAACIQ